MEKILSIIIPTYNAEPYLEKCLQSIASIKEELLELCEVIVVNDGTKDNSVAIAEKYVKQYYNIYKIVNKENGGHGSAINVGVQHITGKYFKVLDADDWIDVKEAEETLKGLKTEFADVVITGYSTYHIGDNTYEKYAVDVEDYKKIHSLSELMDVWEKIQWGMTLHGIIYNRVFYQNLEYKLIEHVYYEDQEYATIPVCFANSIRCMNTYMYVYRIGDVNQSVSDENQIKRLKDAQKVIERLLDAGNSENNYAKGGDRYWMKKTTMLINSYYETALLKKGGKTGRSDAIALERIIAQKNKKVVKINKKKYIIFRLLNYLRISDKNYRKVLGIVKKL